MFAAVVAASAWAVEGTGYAAGCPSRSPMHVDEETNAASAGLEKVEWAGCSRRPPPPVPGVRAAAAVAPRPGVRPARGWPPGVLLGVLERAKPGAGMCDGAARRNAARSSTVPTPCRMAPPSWSTARPGVRAPPPPSEARGVRTAAMAAAAAVRDAAAARDAVVAADTGERPVNDVAGGAVTCTLVCSVK